MRSFSIEPHFDSWRVAAREALNLGLRPNEVSFEVVQRSLDTPHSSLGQTLKYEQSNPGEQQSLFGESEVTPNLSRLTQQPGRLLSVPKEFVDLAKVVSCVRDESRWQILYRLLFRIGFENRNLLKINTDDDVLQVNRWFKSVCRDIHKMHAFVRFKLKMDLEMDPSDPEMGEIFLAWYEPEHLIMRLGAPFFMRRFGDRKWSICSSDESAHWDLKTLTFAAGMPRHLFKQEDQIEELWGSYYVSIFNPARMKPKMMRSEMSPKYWSTLPEAKYIPLLMRAAPARLQAMALNQNEMAIVPQDASVDLPIEANAEARFAQLQTAAKACRVCPFAQHATQTVFGEGSTSAKLMVVGEQPGDQEDVSGQPFVGPAGSLLKSQMDHIGLSRKEVYLTNAVKHFKFTPTGEGRRLHKKASGREAHACLPWLEEEIKMVKPRVILALGVTAGTSILGRLPKMEAERGQILQSERFQAKVILSWHPSAILRTPDPGLRAARERQLLEDLSLAKHLSDQD